MDRWPVRICLAGTFVCAGSLVFQLAMLSADLRPLRVVLAGATGVGTLVAAWNTHHAGQVQRRVELAERLRPWSR